MLLCSVPYVPNIDAVDDNGVCNILFLGKNKRNSVYLVRIYKSTANIRIERKNNRYLNFSMAESIVSDEAHTGEYLNNNGKVNFDNARDIFKYPLLGN